MKKIALFDGDFEMSAKPEPDVPAPREDLQALIEFRVLGFRAFLGLRALGFRVLGFRVLGFRV